MDSLEPVEIAKIILYLMIYIVGATGNFLVIFLIIYLKETRKITHWYVLQLAIADILFLHSIPFAVMEVSEGRWIHPRWTCVLKETVMYVNFYGTIIFLTIMAFDRYLAVCHGLSKMTERLRSLGTCYLVTVIAWLVAVLLCVPVMIYGDLSRECRCLVKFPVDRSQWCVNNLYRVDGKNCSNEFEIYLNMMKCGHESDQSNESEYSGDMGYYDDSFDALLDLLQDSNDSSYNFNEEYVCLHNSFQPSLTAFVYANASVMFVVPLIVISVCYGLIVVRLRSTDAKARKNSERSDSSLYSASDTTKLGKGRIFRRKSVSSGRSNRHKFRVTVMCGFLVLLFAACWLPFHAWNMAKLNGFLVPSKEACASGDLVTVLLIYINSALNPYLYNFLGTFSKRMREVRKHRRTRYLVNQIGLTKIGKSLSRRSSSNVFKDRKTNSGTLPNDERTSPARECTY